MEGNKDIKEMLRLLDKTRRLAQILNDEAEILGCDILFLPEQKDVIKQLYNKMAVVERDLNREVHGMLGMELKWVSPLKLEELYH